MQPGLKITASGVLRTKLEPVSSRDASLQCTSRQGRRKANSGMLLKSLTSFQITKFIHSCISSVNLY